MTKQQPVAIFPAESITPSATPAPFEIKVPDSMVVHGSAGFHYVPARIKSIYADITAISGAANVHFALAGASDGSKVVKYMMNNDILESFTNPEAGSIFIPAGNILGTVGTCIPTDADGKIYFWILTDAGSGSLDKLVVTFDQE